MPVQHPFAQLPPLPRSDSSSLSQSPNQGQGLGQGQVQVQGHEQPQGQGQTRAGSQGRSNFRVPFAAPSVPAVPPQPPPVYPQQQLPQQQPAKATSSSAQWGASGLVGTKRVGEQMVQSQHADMAGRDGLQHAVAQPLISAEQLHATQSR